MTQQEIDEIKARVEAATEAPWMWEGDEITEHKNYSTVVGIKEIGSVYQRYNVLVLKDNNAEFIAHARTDIPALLAEIESLQSQLNGAVEDLKRDRHCLICKHHRSEGGDCYGVSKCGGKREGWQWRGEATP